MNAEILLEDFFVHTIIPPDRTIDTGLALKEIGYLDAGACPQGTDLLRYA